MSSRYSGFALNHGPALALFTVLATLFLWDVLLLDYSLAAFDIILNQPSWKGEFPVSGIQQPILSDSPTAHYPQREFEWGHARLLNNVEFNPYMFTGMPWSPQGVGGFITSLPQLFLDVGGAIDWSTWIRLICAGFFMYLLILELGVGRLAGVFAGILWTYSLHQVVWLEFPQHLATQLWIPLVFLFNIRLLRDGLDTLSTVSLLVVNVLFFTSGYMQIVLYTYIAVGLFNTWYVLSHVGTGETTRNLARWMGVHGIYLGAVLLCSVGLYAEMQAISEGLRGAQDWRGRVDPPGLDLMSLGALLRDLFPRFSEVTHVLTPNYYGGFWDGRYSFDRGNIVESSRYFSVLGVLFAITALLVVWRTRYARVVLAFAATMAIVFSMVYRNDTTISALRLIPLADKGSYSRFITLLTFFGCVLAAYGFQCALGQRYKWLLAAVAVISLYVAGAWWQMEDLAIAQLWYPAVIVTGFLGVVVARKLAGFDWKWVAWLVVVISATDLLVAGYGFNARTEKDRRFPRNNTIRYLLNDPEPYRVAVISDKPLYHPNVLSYYDIPVVEGYLTVLPVEYAAYVKDLFSDVHITRNGIMFLFEANVEALRLLNVKYVLSDQPLDKEHRDLEHVLDSNNHAVYRIKGHLPRIFCATDVVYEDGAGDQIDRYEDALHEYDEPVVLKGEDGHRSYGGSCAVKSLEVYTHGVNAVVESDSPRYLAVPYPYNTNWQATVNGEPAVLEKANGYHMALGIPAGESEVRIRYRNRWNAAAAWLFVAASLGLMIFAWRRSAAPGSQRLILVFIGVVVLFKSSMSLSPVRNVTIPERAALDAPLDVFRQGPSRSERDNYGERVMAENPVEYPLHLESRGLTGLSLLAGTFHQPRLKQAVTVEILDEQGDTLVSKTVAGRNVHNNRWFSVRFPPIRKNTDLRVRVSTEDSDRSRSFVLWRERDGKVCVMSWYELEP